MHNEPDEWMMSDVHQEPGAHAMSVYELYAMGISPDVNNKSRSVTLYLIQAGSGLTSNKAVQIIWKEVLQWSDRFHIYMFQRAEELPDQRTVWT